MIMVTILAEEPLMKIFFVVNGSLYKDQENNYFANTLGDNYLSRYVRICSKLVVGANLLPKTKYTGKNRLSNSVLGKTSIIELPNLSSLKGFIFDRSKFKMIIERLVCESDAVVIRCPIFLGIYVVKAAKKHNKPYLIELVGCPWDAYWNHSWKGKLVAPFMWYVTKKMVKNAPYVLYVTNDFLQRRYPSTGRTINCSDVALPTLDESVLDARLHKIKQMTKNKPIVIGTTAAVDVRYKGQEYVIQAIAELNKQGYNFEYRLVGGGDKTYLQSIAEKYSVADKVIFEGSIPHERIFDYLDDIDIYVQPSQTEGLPRALIEAMSRGCPCVGSNAGGIPELLDTPFIFNSGNVQELANILASFDTEKMIKQAKRNFEFSKGYAKEIIEKRRKEFFQEFAESVKNS